MHMMLHRSIESAPEMRVGTRRVSAGMKPARRQRALLSGKQIEPLTGMPGVWSSKLAASLARDAAANEGYEEQGLAARGSEGDSMRESED